MVKIPSDFERYQNKEHKDDDLHRHTGPAHFAFVTRIVLLDPDTLQRLMILQQGNVTSEKESPRARRSVI
jgi:hypothetical protein